MVVIPQIWLRENNYIKVDAITQITQIEIVNHIYIILCVKMVAGIIGA